MEFKLETDLRRSTSLPPSSPLAPFVSHLLTLFLRPFQIWPPISVLPCPLSLAFSQFNPVAFIGWANIHLPTSQTG
uniref:Uncharacterized protein n=1 Tax=Anguilla anguilla TaxID=7936 RepID=A0A0E9XJ87_ANGAN